MRERKIIITKDGIEYGEDLKTLEELLPTMCVSVAYACRALGKNPINAFVAASGVFTKAEKPEDFGVIKEVKHTNADKIRNMTNEELAESRIDRIDIYCKSDTQMWIGDFNGVAKNREEALKLELKWLESEVG